MKVKAIFQLLSPFPIFVDFGSLVWIVIPCFLKKYFEKYSLEGATQEEVVDLIKYLEVRQTVNQNTIFEQSNHQYNLFDILQ